MSVQWPCITVCQYSDRASQYVSSDRASQYVSTVTVHHRMSVQWPCITECQYSDRASQNVSTVTVHHSISVQWPCLTVWQYSETNVIHFLFNILRIKSPYMFPPLLAHPQEVLNKRHLIYWVRVMSAVCISSSTPILLQPTDITRTQCTKCLLFSASWTWASVARNM
jgi:hypothetical protein